MSSPAPTTPVPAPPRSTAARSRDLAPVVVSVRPGSPASLAGVVPGDEIVRVNGDAPRDVIEWQFATDDAEVELEILRGGLEIALEITKRAGEPLGVEVSSAVFDRVRTCDNHCEFCFIYQLPKGMRRSLYLKDDDYRLSFLYGNFTTLTRFTEADLERVVTERLSPLHVSIHATDSDVRSEMLKNPRGGMSLRWLRALLDHGIAVRGQVVVCPGVNDGAVFDDTMVGVLDRFPDLESVAVVPLGVSRFNTAPAMRPHTIAEAHAVVEAVTEWQGVFLRTLGRRMVHAADEYYLMAGIDFPAAAGYEGFAMHEDGIGMARTFQAEFEGTADDVTGTRRGFFAAVDAPPNPAAYTGLRPRPAAPSCGGEPSASAIIETASSADSHAVTRATGLGQAPGPESGTSTEAVAAPIRLRPRPTAPIGILTGELGQRVIGPLVATLGRTDVRVLPVTNEFFGGNTAVTGLITGADVGRVLADEPEGHRYLLPDVCLSDEGRFLDGVTVDDLPRPVEIVATDGAALRAALERS